jgi:hypothetical protein
MNLRFVVRTLVLVLLSLLVLDPSVLAQDNPARDAKAQLQSIGKGKQVLVYFRDGTAEQGKVGAVADDRFTLKQGDGKGTNTFLLGNVVQVKKAPMRDSTKRAVWVFALIGVVAAASIAGIVAAHNFNHTLTPPPPPA